MLTRLVAGALFAGLSAGVLGALLQLGFVVPLIHEAERYETGALTHFAAPPGGHDHDHEAGGAAGADGAADGAAAGGAAGADGAAAGGAAGADAVAPDTGAGPAPLPHDHPAGTPPHDHATAPGFDLTRSLGTVGFFVVSYTGFALVMIAGFALAERAGHSLTARRGLVWGMAGFLAVQLAPAFGLPPELPGAAAATLEARQVWWAGCVAATVAGLGLIAFGRGAAAIALAIVLIALPHLIGAPTAAYGGVVPPELAAHFTARSLGAGAAGWAVLGTIGGAIWSRRA